MSKTEPGKIETGKIKNAKTDRVLRDDELDAASGGVNNASPMDPLINTAGRNQQLHKRPSR
jgi:hypothetical protein